MREKKVRVCSVDFAFASCTKPWKAQGPHRTGQVPHSRFTCYMSELISTNGARRRPLLTTFVTTTSSSTTMTGSMWAKPFTTDMDQLRRAIPPSTRHALMGSGGYSPTNKRKALDYSTDETRPLKRPQQHQSTEYTDIRAIIITHEDHDFETEALAEEIAQVADLFENHFGVSKCVKVEIPQDVVGSEAGIYVRHRVEEFKQESAGDALHLVYYAGHGDVVDGGSLVVSSARGQSFAWNSLQWNCVFSGDSDTLVILDCCSAGASFRGSFRGCKDVFAACGADQVTAAPGGNSFSNLLVEAGWSLGPEHFTFEHWVERTMELARVTGCVPPVSQSFGDARSQITFRPRIWQLRKTYKEFVKRRGEARREARRRAEMQGRRRADMEIQATNKRDRRCSQLEDVLLTIWQDLDNEDVFPTRAEIMAVESDPDMTLPFSQIKVYRTFRKIKDRTIESQLTGPRGEDLEDDVGDPAEDSDDSDDGGKLIHYNPQVPWY